MIRRQAGKKPTPSAGIIDTLSVKTAEKEHRGYDAGKQIKGGKRHVVVARYRRQSKDFETLIACSEAMIRIAIISLMIHRLIRG